MYKRLIFPVLTHWEAETVHECTLKSVHLYGRTPLLPTLIGRLLIPTDPRLRVNLTAHLRLRSPIGVAAGFDKFGVTPRGINSLGVSHLEVGTVTLCPQPGNPKPRVFRLREDEALINRLGFNSPGVLAVSQNLDRLPPDLVVGISVGANKVSVENDQSLIDFVAGAKLLAPRAAYVAINVSSPNTPCLRGLQQKEALENLLDQLLLAKSGFFPDKPILVKIAPDLTPAALDDILEVITSRAIGGIIATNTTTDPLYREGLTSPNRRQSGGLSGRPLKVRSTEVVRYLYEQTGGKVPIIASGGISNTEDVLEKIRAGARAVQLWTGLVYEGPLLPYWIHRGLSQYLNAHGVSSVEELVGT